MLTLFSTFRKQQSGFTLIEIAVVLVIIGLLVGSFIGTFASRIDTTRRDNTKKELEEIKQVIMAYAFSQGAVVYLPCPDIDVPPDGFENRTAGICDAGNAVGILPWGSLGMDRVDSWGNQYRYWVHADYSNNAGFSIGSVDMGAGDINTRQGNANQTIVTNAVAVVFSHGKNGLGGVSATGINRPAIPAPGNGHDDENENIDANFVFMSRTPTEEGAATTGGIFDDILVWINSYELKAKMVDVGMLPP